MKKLIMNVTLKVENLIIKYEEGDIVASLNLWYVALKGREGRRGGGHWIVVSGAEGVREKGAAYASIA